MDKLVGLIQDIEDKFTDIDYLIEQYVRTEGASPLDVLCERESRLQIIELLKDLRKALSPMDMKILSLYIKNKSQKDIASICKISQQAVSKRLKGIPGKMKKYSVNGIPFFDNYRPEEFLVKYSKLEAHAPTGCNFPHEYLQKINTGGKWGKLKGRKIWVSKHKCCLPEYFENSFRDKNTICTICKHCKREEKNDRTNGK